MARRVRCLSRPEEGFFFSFGPRLKTELTGLPSSGAAAEEGPPQRRHDLPVELRGRLSLRRNRLVAPALPAARLAREVNRGRAGPALMREVFLQGKIKKPSCSFYSGENKALVQFLFVCVYGEG